LATPPCALTAPRKRPRDNVETPLRLAATGDVAVTRYAARMTLFKTVPTLAFLIH